MELWVWSSPGWPAGQPALFALARPSSARHRLRAGLIWGSLRARLGTRDSRSVRALRTYTPERLTLLTLLTLRCKLAYEVTREQREHCKQRKQRKQRKPNSSWPPCRFPFQPGDSW